VVGAGPFGLAVAAALKAANVDLVLLGQVMSFWRDHVPAGTRLLSGLNGLSFSRDDFSMYGYQRSVKRPLSLPVSAEDFLAYGQWYHQSACPQADERLVASIGRRESEFVLLLEDGEEITADRVVVAVGMKPFAFRPPQFAALPSSAVSHASSFRDLARFEAKQVLIIGSGQSALECAALLVEHKAHVEVIARSLALPWRDTGHLEWSSARPTGIKRFADLPRATLRRLLDDPDFFYRLPAAARRVLLRRTLRTAISADLKSRLNSVQFSMGRSVAAAHFQAGRIVLELDDRSTRSADHVLLGTGYRVDIKGFPLLAPELVRRIKTTDEYPELTRRMESSVSGLFFAGAAAAWNFGPIMWFVRSAPWSAQRICRSVW